MSINRENIIILGTTYGVEIEVPSITKEDTNKFSSLAKNLCIHTRDASVESRKYRLGNMLLVNCFCPVKGARELITGMEIVSGIRKDSPEEALEFFSSITKELKDFGETSKDYRCGIHFHISMEGSLRVLKAILRLAMHLESVFFYIAGMGYPFRGIGNDSAYMRPITENGPLYVPTPDYFRPVFIPEEVLKSTSIDEFWNRFGDSRVRSSTRYTPIRYHWINPFSILKQGSLEFRIFNLSLNPVYLVAALEFCRAFCRFTLGTNLQAMKVMGLTDINSIYFNPTKKEVLRIYDNFVKLVEFDAGFSEVLRNIIIATPKISLENSPKLCHLRNMTIHWERNSEYMPNRKIKYPEKIRVLDIHELNGE